MKPMQPTLTFRFPEGKDWRYEVKYDGFRATLAFGKGFSLVSRNGKELADKFPEAAAFFKKNREVLAPFLPLSLDGELTVLTNPLKGDFAAMQRRGRLRSEAGIGREARLRPCKFLAFDLLVYRGKSCRHLPYLERKKMLRALFEQTGWPLAPDGGNPSFVQMVPADGDGKRLWEKIQIFGGEGIVAKKSSSRWEEGKSGSWLKYKNWKKAACFIHAYDKRNGYFRAAVFKGEQVFPVGSFRHGLEREEYEALKKTIRENAAKEDGRCIYIVPSICVELKFLQWAEQNFREVVFSRFLLGLSPEQCTYERFKEAANPFPFPLTHPEKILWPKQRITKSAYIDYLQRIRPYMAPFLKDRPLTVVRYPHGVEGEAFFQKNCPDYAPPFVETAALGGIRYILCNSPDTLIWLGNQGAIEFHIPFCRADDEKNPAEIVIDLDPPSKREFPLAVEAAAMIKEKFADPLGLKCYLKSSGKHGLHVYFPVGGSRAVTWEESRAFTSFLSRFLLAGNERIFTVERLKKNRGRRLYIDYTQHGEGKTIICPYSARGTGEAGVAAPLDWGDLPSLSPDPPSFEEAIKRAEKGDPFGDYFETDNGPVLREIIEFLKRK